MARNGPETIGGGDGGRGMRFIVKRRRRVIRNDARSVSSSHGARLACQYNVHPGIIGSINMAHGGAEALARRRSRMLASVSGDIGLNGGGWRRTSMACAHQNQLSVVIMAARYVLAWP